MEDLTARQVFDAREALEKDAATILGMMLFEFSRLEVNLGLCVVGSDGGKKLEELTKQVENFSFHKKLDFLSQYVEANFSKGSECHVAYTEWITRAHTSRQRRNQLVHGRWGVDPIQGCVINVIGLPTSSEQSESRYSIADLESVLMELIQLQARLHEIRKQWPL